MSRKEAIIKRAINRATGGDFSLLRPLIEMIPKLQSVGIADGRAEIETARARIAKKLEKISERLAAKAAAHEAKKSSPPDDDNSGGTGP